MSSPSHTTTSGLASRFYRPELDCLRFFAFFAVSIYHSFSGDPDYYAARHVPFGWFFASAASAGRFGVDLFFLLSAYLITELLLRERERFGSLDVRSFYLRRILRIWPLYFLGLLIGVVLTKFDSQQYFPLSAALWFVFLAGNWRISLGGPLNSPMLLLWSVSFEEQFYLLWPVLLAHAEKKEIRKTLTAIALTMIGIASASRLLLASYARARHSEVMIFTNTLTRLDPLAFGILCAAWLPRTQLTLSRLPRILIFLAGSLIWLAAGHYYNLGNRFLLLGYPAISLGALLLFLSVLDSQIAPPWLRYLGKISYGLYVFHELAQYLAYVILHREIHTLRVFAVYWILSLAMTIAFAALSYRFFESPFLRLKERFARVQSRPV